MEIEKKLQTTLVQVYFKKIYINVSLQLRN